MRTATVRRYTTFTVRFKTTGVLTKVAHLHQGKVHPYTTHYTTDLVTRFLWDVVTHLPVLKLLRMTTIFPELKKYLGGMNSGIGKATFCGVVGKVLRFRNKYGTQQAKMHRFKRRLCQSGEV
ncbi:hypothetical protein TNCV_4329241 [Trichonephila clavipes]|nr:hypothetical protein TNCV_4329241 [Trichonephila clavipes]